MPRPRSTMSATCSRPRPARSDRVGQPDPAARQPTGDPGAGQLHGAGGGPAGADRVVEQQVAAERDPVGDHRGAGAAAAPRRTDRVSRRSGRRRSSPAPGAEPAPQQHRAVHRRVVGEQAADRAAAEVEQWQRRSAQHEARQGAPRSRSRTRVCRPRGRAGRPAPRRVPAARARPPARARRAARRGPGGRAARARGRRAGPAVWPATAVSTRRRSEVGERRHGGEG